MNEGKGILINSELYTPLYKIFFLVGILTSFVFICFFSFVLHRNEELSDAYRTLNSDGKKSFSTLTAYHQTSSGKQKRHIYTYLVTDEYGKLHEMNEYVDNKSHLRLRVGNTVVTRQKKILIAGKERIISRIEGNNQILPNFNYLEIISLVGIGFSILLSFCGLILFLFKKDLA